MNIISKITLRQIDITFVFAMLIGLSFLLVQTILRHFYKKERESIKQETEETLKNIQAQPDYDVLKLLYKNVIESTEYYIISKRQANKSFIFAIIVCILGFAIYISGFVAVVFFNENISVFTTIAGTVVELIAGLGLWLYDKCNKQLSEYHKRLNSTEKYLTSIQMIDKMSMDKKDEMYKWLIQNVMLLDTDYYSLMFQSQSSNNTNKTVNTLK